MKFTQLAPGMKILQQSRQDVSVWNKLNCSVALPAQHHICFLGFFLQVPSKLTASGETRRLSSCLQCSMRPRAGMGRQEKGRTGRSSRKASAERNTTPSTDTSTARYPVMNQSGCRPGVCSMKLSGFVTLPVSVCRFDHVSGPRSCDVASDWDGHSSRNPLHSVPGSYLAGNQVFMENCHAF